MTYKSPLRRAEQDRQGRIRAALEAGSFKYGKATERTACEFAPRRRPSACGDPIRRGDPYARVVTGDAEYVAVCVKCAKLHGPNFAE